MTTHIMLDLETWGKRPGCDIRSIGAVVFDPVEGVLCSGVPAGSDTGTFYIATDNPHALYVEDEFGLEKSNSDTDIRKYPLHRDPETVQWWNDQSDEAQAAFENPVDLRDGLIYFVHWLFDHHDLIYNVNEPSTNLKLWANDPHFDVSILAEAYHAVGLPIPWHYRAPRSMKTATDLAGLPRDEYATATVPHHALHDAIAQAQTVCKCYARLGLAG